MKNIFMYKKWIITLGLMAFLTLPCFANRPDTANPYFEINRIMGTMATANHISFNMTYYYEDLDSAGLQRDTLSGWYKINAAHFYAKLDSTYIIQNDFYNIAVNKRDSSIIIGRTKTVFPAVIQKDVLDATLQSAYLSSIVSSDSANTRKLSLIFKDNSPYYSYDLVYDTSTYNMNYVKYRLRHYGIVGMQDTYYTQIKLLFTNYQTNAFTDSVFDTSPYFNRVNGVFVAAPAYSSYEIFNQVMNQ